MAHSIEVPGALTLEELGTKLGQLRYDALLVVLCSLGDELIRQAEKDKAEGKIQLHTIGEEAVEHLVDCGSRVVRMLRVSIPYMADEILSHPLLFNPDTID